MTQLREVADIKNPRIFTRAIEVGIFFLFAFASALGHGSVTEIKTSEQELKEIVQKMQLVPLKPAPSIGAANNNLGQGARQRRVPIFQKVDQAPFFDLPVTYNKQVRDWITYFQVPGKKWFTKWLERSSRYLPLMQGVLQDKGLPQDLAFVAMIESGFSSHATSQASAVGYWQFIKETANRYGLTTNWWLDERRDFTKSTHAAARYLGDLYKIFGAWYLTAAAYNMGEGRLQRLIRKHGTTNFWELARKSDFPKETSEYIPKLIAAILISKAPRLYGFEDLNLKTPHAYEYFHVPGGTDLVNMAREINTPVDALQALNPELTKGFVPRFVNTHRIRIPSGSTRRVSEYMRRQIY